MSGNRGVPVSIGQAVKYLVRHGYERRIGRGSLVIFHPAHPERGRMRFSTDLRDELNSNTARKIGRDLGLGGVAEVVRVLRAR